MRGPSQRRPVVVPAWLLGTTDRGEGSLFAVARNTELWCLNRDRVQRHIQLRAGEGVRMLSGKVAGKG